MRRMLIACLISLVWTVPAAAQDLPPDQGARQAPASPGEHSGCGRSVGPGVRSSLGRPGYTDIQMMPDSFLVRAGDRHGAPVMMVLSPGSMTVLTEAPPGDASGSPPDQAPNAAGAAPDRCVLPSTEDGRLDVVAAIEVPFDLPSRGARLD